MIADDQPVIRDGLKFIVEQDKDIKVVGCAGNGLKALELCTALKPDLVLMDIVMPVCDGIEGTRLIKENDSRVKVIILTTFNDEDKISYAMANGADGYVLKDIGIEELILTIKGIHKGLRVIQQEAFGMLAKRLDTGSGSPKKRDAEKLNDFSERELEIMRLIVYGRSNKEIAADLSLSEGGVRNMISALLSKLDFKDRTQLAVFAVRNNIV